MIFSELDEDVVNAAKIVANTSAVSRSLLAV